MDSDEYGSYVTVTFYDTSKGDEDVDVNQILIDKILEVLAVTFKMRVIVFRFIIMIFCYCNPILPSYIHRLFFTGGAINRIKRYTHRRVW